MREGVSHIRSEFSSVSQPTLTLLLGQGFLKTGSVPGTVVGAENQAISVGVKTSVPVKVTFRTGIWTVTRTLSDRAQCVLHEVALSARGRLGREGKASGYVLGEAGGPLQ